MAESFPVTECPKYKLMDFIFDFTNILHFLFVSTFTVNFRADLGLLLELLGGGAFRE